ncbi:hypothetical protein ACFX2G_035751 [Malus domestica]
MDDSSTEKPSQLLGTLVSTDAVAAPVQGVSPLVAISGSPGLIVPPGYDDGVPGGLSFGELRPKGLGAKAN